MYISMYVSHIALYIYAHIYFTKLSTSAQLNPQKSCLCKLGLIRGAVLRPRAATLTVHGSRHP